MGRLSKRGAAVAGTENEANRKRTKRDGGKAEGRKNRDGDGKLRSRGAGGEGAKVVGNIGGAHGRRFSSATTTLPVLSTEEKQEQAPNGAARRRPRLRLHAVPE